MYVHFGAEGTAALSTTGEVVWRTRLSYVSQHGSGGSPVLYRGLLIVNCDGNGGDAFVAALDVRTGKIRWRTERRLPADQAYSTPLVIRVGDQDQLVSVGAYRAAAYDPANGKEIWRVELRRRLLERPAPGVWRRTGLHRHRLPAAHAAGGANRRQGRRHEHTRCLDPASWRAVHSVTDPGRRPAVSRQRRWHRVVSRRGDGIATVAASARGHLLGVADPRRGSHIFSQRRRPGDGDCCGRRPFVSWPRISSMARRWRRWPSPTGRLSFARVAICIG